MSEEFDTVGMAGTGAFETSFPHSAPTYIIVVIAVSDQWR
jgi:hypothetical protein